MDYAFLLTQLEPYMDLLQLVLFLAVTFAVLTIILKIVERRLMKKAKTKSQQSNIAIFTSLMKYLFIFFALVFSFSYYYGSWGEAGLIAGLLTAALGWALQKPITGVVAWLILVVQRPIHIGDRVIIEGITGDIVNITLTHIFLNEVGGTIQGEEESGRTVMIPTSIIFEEEIINYTHKDDYILDEVTATVTYESNLKTAEKIMMDSVRGTMKDYVEGLTNRLTRVMRRSKDKFARSLSEDPHIRLDFKESGINVTVRYKSIATKRNQISTDIRREIHKKISKSEDVEFAYPHTEIIMKK